MGSDMYSTIQSCFQGLQAVRRGLEYIAADGNFSVRFCLSA